MGSKNQNENDKFDNYAQSSSSIKNENDNDKFDDYAHSSSKNNIDNNVDPLDAWIESNTNSNVKSDDNNNSAADNDNDKFDAWAHSSIQQKNSNNDDNKNWNDNEKFDAWADSASSGGDGNSNKDNKYDELKDEQVRCGEEYVCHHNSKCISSKIYSLKKDTFKTVYECKCTSNEYFGSQCEYFNTREEQTNVTNIGFIVGISSALLVLIGIGISYYLISKKKYDNDVVLPTTTTTPPNTITPNDSKNTNNFSFKRCRRSLSRPPQKQQQHSRFPSKSNFLFGSSINDLPIVQRKDSLSSSSEDNNNNKDGIMKQDEDEDVPYWKTIQVS